MPKNEAKPKATVFGNNNAVDSKKSKIKKKKNVNSKANIISKKNNLSGKVKNNAKKKFAKNENDTNNLHKFNKKVTIILIIIFGILLIVSTYAWFSTNLNVKIREFNMVVTKNDGLSISFDAINYGNIVEISKEALIDNLVNTYPDNENQWASNGLIPVSSNGIANSNTQFFDFYESNGVLYSIRDKENGFIYTEKRDVRGQREFNYFIAFDLFFRNDSGSPIPDNLYLDTDTSIMIEDGAEEEMVGLLNTVRIGFVPIGSVDLDASPIEAQNIQCNNNCRSIIFEPNSREHTNLSIERSQKYGITLVDGMYFPTYATIGAGGPIYVRNSVSGSPYIDKNLFDIQETFTEEEIDQPMFKVPDGVTKVRVYLWLEGQDIDSLETDSVGADLTISISFVKDTEGYNTDAYYNE